MSLPFFFDENISAAAGMITLSEPTSKHVVQVLRMRPGEGLQLTDGKGLLLTAEIAEDNRKKCTVKIVQSIQLPAPARETCIAISLLKNSSRFEWFLEKATEMGISRIVPLVCKRTEKQHFRAGRMQNILVSAMLQSRQCHLPILEEPAGFADWVKKEAADYRKYIAYCGEENAKQPFHLQIDSSSGQLIAIGPEGDFTEAEIQSALEQGFVTVSLGETRLRTETAGLVAAALLTQL